MITCRKITKPIATNFKIKTLAFLTASSPPEKLTKRTLPALKTTTTRLRSITMAKATPS